MRNAAIILLSIFAALSAATPVAAYEGYTSPEEMYEEIYQMEKDYPEFVNVGEYGESLEGRPLLFVRIARPDGKERPEAMIAANIHGNEWIGNRMAMGAVKRLLESNEKIHGSHPCSIKWSCIYFHA